MRETREVTLPSGIKATLKTYLTAGEYDDIQDVFLSSVNLSITKTDTEVGRFTGSVVTKAKYKTLETIVIKIGDKEKPDIQFFKDMRIDDIDFLATECDKLTPKKK